MNPLAYLDQIGLHPLPSDAVALLHRLNAPPRLIAHSALVHDVARRLVDALMTRWPMVGIDKDSIVFGAATHDIGKVYHSEELTGPGHQHEPTGRSLMIAAGISPQLARFCVTHGTWYTDKVAMEDILVALADTCWKGSRNPVLEEHVIERIKAVYPEEPWETMLFVDQLVENVAARADERLTWQAQFSATVL
jgi:hypothetical protein